METYDPSKHDCGIGRYGSGFAGPAPNTDAVGALVTVISRGHAQVREQRVDNTHTSGQGTLLHYGLTSRAAVDIVVRWADGLESRTRNVRVNRRVQIRHPHLGG
ncbi:MAG: ASPIC/UnbV domain-containing protein [Sandaracinaceae bacterium]|nr:ASPIC/UnbV domain-containing protein [Sandaracinaceae bacterium]